MIGERVGHFEILEKLGEGGMGVVYKARDLELNRLVAIKALAETAAADSERRQRFVQEAQAASALNHPNIVTVYEIFRESGKQFIAMELVAGRTLEEAIDRKGLRLPEALRIAEQVAGALAAAHEIGIVHRDVKPANVMVTDQGHVKVLDFGLAKLTERTTGAQDSTLTDVSLRTEKGTVRGTVAYMSPEQAEGKEVDWRSDIFSFGSLLYEMVTGQRAFQGESRVLTLAAVIDKEPASVSEVTPVAPRELQRLIARCLRKKPQERAQHLLDVKHSLEEMRTELESGQLSAAGPAAMVVARKRSWWPVAVGAALVVAAGGLFLASRSSHPTTVVYKATPLTSYPGTEADPALSPDGKQLAFAWNGPDEHNFDIYVRRIGGGDPLRLTKDAASDRSPAWSRDGDFIAFLRSEGELGTALTALYVIPALGGAERRLCALGAISATTKINWTADGKALVVSETHSAAVIQAETGDKTTLSIPLNRKSHFHLKDPSLSPDGKKLAFIVSDAEEGDSIHAAGFSSSHQIEGPIRELFRTRFGSFAFLAWAPDGEALYFTDRRGGAPKLFRIASRDGSQPEPVLGLGEHIQGISVAGSRLVYAYAFQDYNLWRIEMGPTGKPGSPSRFLQSTRDERSPEFSLDGSQIAFISDRSGEDEIWVAASDGTNLRRVTKGASPTQLSWAPDGSELVWGGNPEKGRGIFRIRVQGGAVRQVGPPGAMAGRWSGDGKWIYCTWAPSGDHYRVYRIDASGQDKPTAVTESEIRGDTTNIAGSPDGKAFWFLGRGLARVPAAGGEPVVVAAHKGVRNYAAGSDGIYFVETGSSALQLCRYSDVKVVEVARFEEPFPMMTGTGTRRFTISPDGKTIVYARVDQRIEDLMVVDDFR